MKEILCYYLAAGERFGYFVALQVTFPQQACNFCFQRVQTFGRCQVAIGPVARLYGRHLLSDPAPYVGPRLLKTENPDNSIAKAVTTV